MSASYFIRCPRTGRRLAVPDMPPDARPAERVEVFSLVLRRMPLEALDAAREIWADRRGRIPATAPITHLAALMQRIPLDERDEAGAA